MRREHWQALADRHCRSETEPRCRDCRAYWPCSYRLRADRELAGYFSVASSAASGV